MAQIFHVYSEAPDGPETSTWGSLCESSRPALLHLECPLTLKAKVLNSRCCLGALISTANAMAIGTAGYTAMLCVLAFEKGRHHAGQG
jgi:hypothetical protein